jgi:hypothetical protein
MKFDVTPGDAAVTWIAAHRHRNGVYSVLISTPTVKRPAVVLGSSASSDRPGLDRLVDLYATNGETLLGTRPTRVLLRADLEPERRALGGLIVEISESPWTVRLLCLPGGILQNDEPVGTWDAAPFRDPLASRF